MRAPRVSREVMIVGRPYVCPYCKSQRTVSKGTRTTKGLGPRRLRRCKACGRKFTPKHQQAHVAASHEPKSSVKSAPPASAPSGAFQSADEWWKLNDEPAAPQLTDETEPELPL